MTDPTNSDRLAAIEARLDKGSQRMDVLDEAVKINTNLTQEIHDILAAARMGFKVLGWTGTVLKWLGAIAGALVSIYVFVYAATHGGATPK
jgi:hypothetical protein